MQVVPPCSCNICSFGFKCPGGPFKCHMTLTAHCRTSRRVVWPSYGFINGHLCCFERLLTSAVAIYDILTAPRRLLLPRRAILMGKGSRLPADRQTALLTWKQGVRPSLCISIQIMRKSKKFPNSWNQPLITSLALFGHQQHPV